MATLGIYSRYTADVRELLMSNNLGLSALITATMALVMGYLSASIILGWQHVYYLGYLIIGYLFLFASGALIVWSLYMIIFRNYHRRTQKSPNLVHHPFIVLVFGALMLNCSHNKLNWAEFIIWMST